MKRVKILGFALVAFVSLSSLVAPTVDDGEDSKRCRCKKESCLAGNLVSFRPICERNGDCAAADDNCYS
jgi:hypothetical protein